VNLDGSGRRLRWSALKPKDTTLVGLFWWALGYLFTPVAGVLILISTSGRIGGAWDAAHGGGLLGSLQVQREDCSYHAVGGNQCTGLYGAFQSDDGTVSLPNAFLDGIPAGAGPGSDVRVRFTGQRHPPIVYKASGSHEWLLIAAFMLAAIGGFVVWGLTVRARLQGRFLPWMWDRPRSRSPRDARAPDKTGHTERPKSSKRKREIRRRRRSAG
jgi:hypothetical protein